MHCLSAVGLVEVEVGSCLRYSATNCEGQRANLVCVCYRPELISESDLIWLGTWLRVHEGVPGIDDKIGIYRPNQQIGKMNDLVFEHRAASFVLKIAHRLSRGSKTAKRSWKCIKPLLSAAGRMTGTPALEPTDLGGIVLTSLEVGRLLACLARTTSVFPFLPAESCPLS